MSDAAAQSAHPSGSILKTLIENSIAAFPEDAHQHVLKYLLDTGLDETQALKFRQAWSKVVLGTQAFGKGSKKDVNPALFSEELIRELSYSDEAVVKIVNSCISAAKLNKQTETTGKRSSDAHTNPRDGVASLDAINSLAEDLTKLLANLYETPSIPHGDEGSSQIELLETIGLFRKSLRGTRIVWSGSKASTQGEYVPLDSSVHGFPDLRKGRIDMQLRTERNDLNVYMSTDELLGVSISSKQAVHQERGWNAYLCLTELLSSRGLHLFPLPIGVQRDPASLAATFAFESAPDTALLRTLQGPTLSTYLRRTPVVIHHWCAQLGAAYRALQTCSGSLMKPVRAGRDVFVREDGLLLIGNVAFDATPPSRKPRQSNAFLQLSCEVLQASLCLSRTEAVVLQDDFKSSSSGMDADEEDTRKAGQDTGVESDVVFAVVVGSTLDLVVAGHHCSTIAVESPMPAATRSLTRKENDAVYRNANRGSASPQKGADPGSSAEANARATPSASTLAINIAVTTGSYQQYVAVERVNRPTSSSFTIKIDALHPGVVSLHFSALVRDDSAGQGGFGGSGPRLRLRGSRVKVVIVPAYSIMSVPLQDMIGHLEECHRHGDPRILLNSQLFRRLHPAGDEEDLHSTTTFARKNQDVQKGWQDIKRVINNHGCMHIAAK